MRKFFKWIAIASIVLSVSMAATGCRRNGETDVDVDNNKSQLNIGNLYAGFRDEWLQKWISDFEAANAETEFEPGKKGVQIWVDNQREAYAGKTLLDSISSYTQDIYFTEDAYLYDYVANDACAEITDIVKENLSDKYGENTSIESKMKKSLRDFYELEGKYFMLPVNETYFGIIYDKDLFESGRGFYISKESTDGDTKFTKEKSEFSAGVDGVEGTYDDGLPATYEQFYDLLQRIKDSGYMPMIWSGKYAATYGGRLLYSMWADAEGADQMNLNYTLNGTAKTLVKSIEKSTKKYKNVDYDTSKVVYEEATDINEDNAVLLQKQAGKYYALQFVSNIIGDPTNYDSSSFAGSASHTQAQNEYLYSKYNYNKQRIAMLVDGSWWRAESASTFDNMVTSYGDEASMQSRNFGFMPMPKPNSDMLGQSSAYFTETYSIGFISSYCASSKLNLAKSFLQYCFTESAMKDYTKITDTTMPYNYGMNETDESEYRETLTEYGKNMWDIHKNADIGVSESTNTKYINNHGYFTEDWNFRTANDVCNTRFAFTAFHSYPNLDPEVYFNGMYTYHIRNSMWKVDG